MVGICNQGVLKEALVASQVLKHIADALPALKQYEQGGRSAGAKEKMKAATTRPSLMRPAGAEGEDAPAS